MYIYRYASPLGGITLSSNGTQLTGLWFDGQKHFGSTLTKDYEERPLPIFDRCVRWLDTYFDGEAPDFTPPMRVRDTPFRTMVWDILLTIPYGCTMTYGEIAQQVAQRQGRPTMSPQAVGGAVGHNPIALVIPCHRVVGSDGGLTGYAGGIERKKRLLAMERTNV